MARSAPGSRAAGLAIAEAAVGGWCESEQPGLPAAGVDRRRHGRRDVRRLVEGAGLGDRGATAAAGRGGGARRAAAAATAFAPSATVGAVVRRVADVPRARRDGRLVGVVRKTVRKRVATPPAARRAAAAATADGAAGRLARARALRRRRTRRRARRSARRRAAAAPSLPACSPRAARWDGARGCRAASAGRRRQRGGASMIPAASLIGFVCPRRPPAESTGARATDGGMGRAPVTMSSSSTVEPCAPSRRRLALAFFAGVAMRGGSSGPRSNLPDGISAVPRRSPDRPAASRRSRPRRRGRGRPMRSPQRSPPSTMVASFSFSPKSGRGRTLVATSARRGVLDVAGLALRGDGAAAAAAAARRTRVRPRA